MAHPESQKGCQAFPLWSNHHWLGLLDGYRHRPHTEVQERPSQGWFSHTKCDSLLMDAMGLKTTHGNRVRQIYCRLLNKQTDYTLETWKQWECLGKYPTGLLSPRPPCPQPWLGDTGLESHHCPEPGGPFLPTACA